MRGPELERDGEPVRSTRKRKTTKPHKPYVIEVRSLMTDTGKWKIWGRYKSEQGRDDALSRLPRTYGKVAEFRPKDD